MAVANGYGKTVTSGSVFMYDVGDVVNSYKGKPTTNILGIISYSFGTQNDTYFKTNYGTELVNIPALGTVTSHYCNIYNDYYGGSGACCPSPFWFGSPAVSPSTTYTYQIIYRTTTGYANPNYMYHYEFGPSGYLTEYGLWDSSRQESLGDGWYHAWGTFTSHASATSFATFLFHYEYGVWNKIQIAGVMLTQGNNIIPPKQFLNVNGTRSATQGLLPLIGNSTIDLSNVSFDSNAQIVFDGTNDYISIPSSNVFDVSEVTVEVVVKPYAISQNGFWFEKGTVNTQYSLFMEGSNIVWRQAGNSQYTSTNTMTVNRWNHVIGTFKSGQRITYVNGTSRTSDSLVYTLNTNQGAQFIGSYNSGGYYYNGEIAIVKVYNRVLSAAEVKQNYNKYKTRFNLP
jgi:hypothetical protein